MKTLVSLRSHALWPYFLLLSVASSAQQKAAPLPMGTVATRDALVSGGLEVRGEQANLLTNANITAYGHTASVELARGGEVLVCSTSQFHLFHSGTELSLLFGLDRGAVEIHGGSQPLDVVLTPDLRFTFATTGQLDLRLRVTSNGDTCVENRGVSAPVLAVTDVFSDASYRLQPGQHVLFERGSLREVVDQERSPCGCPAPSPPPAIQVAASGATSAENAEAHNPFPAAVSQGLAPETKPANAAPAGETHAQVSTTLAFGTKEGAAPAVAASSAAVSPAAPAEETTLAPPPSPPGAHDLAHAIGRFFRRLFGRKD